MSRILYLLMSFIVAGIVASCGRAAYPLVSVDVAGLYPEKNVAYKFLDNQIDSTDYWVIGTFEADLEAARSFNMALDAVCYKARKRGANCIVVREKVVDPANGKLVAVRGVVALLPDSIHEVVRRNIQMGLE